MRYAEDLAIPAQESRIWPQCDVRIFYILDKGVHHNHKGWPLTIG